MEELKALIDHAKQLLVELVAVGVGIFKAAKGLAADGIAVGRKAVAAAIAYVKSLWP